MTIESISPENIVALVVGVEKYAAGAEWDVDGPASDACRFWNWLGQLHVPTGNVHLFLSPLDCNRGLLDHTGPPSQPATRELIYRELTTALRRQTGELLVVYWSGHGVITLEGTRRLFYSDACGDNLLNLDLNSLLRSLRSDYWRAFPQQLWLVDACANYVSTWDVPVTLPEATFPSGRLTPSRQQFVIMGARAGELAGVSSREKTGYFSRELLSLLSSETGSGLPDPSRLLQQLQERFLSLPRQWTNQPNAFLLLVS